MTNTKSILTGISIIYFNAESKNIYADLPPNKEQAKRLSKRIYKDAMTALSQQNDKLICKCNVN